MNQVNDMFAEEDKETKPYGVNVLGDDYIVLPGVFSPKVRRNSSWFAEKIPPLLHGKSFLEIGSGAGVLPVRCAKMGYSVVATDIDPSAVKNTLLNAEKHNVKIDVRLGSIFEPLNKEESFDNIFWNHPWIYTEEIVDLRHKESYDTSYKALKKFLQEGKNYLEPGGCILLGTGSIARLDLIEEWAKQENYKYEIVESEKQPLQVNGNNIVEFLVYRITR